MPVMTAATTSGYTVSSSTIYSGGVEGWRLFDDSTSTSFLGVGTSGWIKVAFPSATLVAGYSLLAWAAELTRAPRAWTLEGSNTGAFSGEQAIMDTRTGQTGWNTSVRSFTCASPGTYSYVRLNITENDGDPSYLRMAEMQIFPPA